LLVFKGQLELEILKNRSQSPQLGLGTLKDVRGTTRELWWLLLL
jgi:hypothetical protein